MAEEHNSNHYYKCPYCACIFLNQADLQRHLACFGNVKGEHEFNYRKIHGRLEHGYSEE